MQDWIHFFTTLTGEKILTGTLYFFFFIAFIQLFFYLFFYTRIAWTKNHVKEAPAEEVPLSVIICARNEARNLRRFLPSILEQDYSNYEVIVVNDCSQDDTEVVLKRFCQKYEHLRTTFLREDEKFVHGKKLALTVGIKAAQFEYVVLTDADCQAVSKNWLKQIAASLGKKSIVLGYGGFLQRKGFLNRLIRFDTLWIALQYLSFAKSGLPYMGVGRNLAYHKSLFFGVKGFASHARLESGDDDLFINQVANHRNTTVLYNEDSHTRSRPKIRFKHWVDQKRRHFTTSGHYRFIHKFLLSLEPASRVLFYALFATLMFFPKYRIIAGSIALFRLLVFFLIVPFVKKHFKEPGIIGWALFFDIIFPFLYFYIHLLNIFAPYKRWR